MSLKSMVAHGARNRPVSHHANRVRDVGALALWVILALLFSPMGSAAGDVSFKVEPGVAIPLTAPQSDIYDIGGGQSVKALFGIGRYFSIGPSTTFLFLPGSVANSEAGTAWGFGGGMRLRRPIDAESAGGVSPWIDADIFYVRTGSLNRPSFDVAVGLSVPVGETRTFLVGPFVRYLHVYQGVRAGYDNRDAKILSVGISFEAGSGVERARAPGEVRTVTRTRDVQRDVISCPDRDNDGILDNIDHCPDVYGDMYNWGCPPYEKVVVKRDTLELRSKILFEWDKAVLLPPSIPLLDEVVQALKDNRGFRVQVQGYADSTGAYDYNQTLSEERADVVLEYLVEHGISRDRLDAKGFGESLPAESNITAAGRDENRRVEFVVYFIILDSGGAE